MARRNLVATLRRILAGQGITSHVRDGNVVEFTVAGDYGVYPVAGLVSENRIIAFYATAGVRAPEGSVGDVVLWAVQANDDLLLGNFEVDPDDGTVRYKTSLDAKELTVETLEKVLPDLWRLGAAMLDLHLHDLVQVMLGTRGVEGGDEGSDEEDDDDEGDVDEEGDAQPDEREDDGEMASGSGSDDDAEAVLAEFTEDLYDALFHVVADRYGDDVAHSIEGALDGLAALFGERVLDEATPDADIQYGVEGDDAEAVLSLSADGVPPLRFRFQPEQLRALLARDEHGIDLYYHATAPVARRVLERGFLNQVHEVVLEHSRTAEGFPDRVNDKRRTRRVLLTDAPLPLDDRTSGGSVLRVRWEGDAARLGRYEWVQTAYTEGDDGTWEAVVERPPIRRFLIPAAVLNKAVAEGVVRVSG
ncbi:MAG TPA: hypothetical protein VKA84_05990 [Gemmatimonadaceae bacterium]|nr:hypothetical protein [Gemmatimonadaceae bacterium]